jgi:hypothetical protein
MKTNHLRVYAGPPESAIEERAQRETVTVPLMAVLPLLADAHNADRTWLGDFEDDDITISMDLYEILLAYQHYCCPEAS